MSIVIRPLKTRDTKYAYISKITKKELHDDDARELESVCSIKNYDLRNQRYNDYQKTFVELNKKDLNPNFKINKNDTVSEVCSAIFNQFETLGEFKRFINNLPDDKKTKFIELLILSGVAIIGYNLFTLQQTPLPGQIIDYIQAPLALPPSAPELLQWKINMGVTDVSKNIASTVSNSVSGKNFLSNINAGITVGASAITNKIFNIFSNGKQSKFSLYPTNPVNDNQKVTFVKAPRDIINESFGNVVSKEKIDNITPDKQINAEKELEEFLQENLPTTESWSISSVKNFFKSSDPLGVRKTIHINDQRLKREALEKQKNEIYAQTTSTNNLQFIDPTSEKETQNKIINYLKNNN